MDKSPYKLNKVVHQRTRALASTSTYAANLIKSDRPLPVTTNDEIEQRVENANERLLQSTNDATNRMLQGQRVVNLTAEQQETSLMNRTIVSGERSRNRPDIIGHQRITIFFSHLDVKQLAKHHHCNVSTVLRIKNDPLSSIGMTWRQFRTILSDQHEARLMGWYADTTGIPRGIIPPLPPLRRPGRQPVLSRNDQSFLKLLLTHNPDFYLDELLEQLIFFNPNVDISLSTLSRTLSKMGYSKKRNTKVIPLSDAIERRIFKMGIDRLVSHTNQLVFLDETANSRGSVQRNSSWSARGMQSIGTARSAGTRMSFMGAIDVHGIVSFNLFEGNVNRINFLEFLILDLVPLMNPFPQARSILVLDNARIHGDANLFSHILWENFSILTLFLPPYSPDLNPIERMFSVAKSLMKRILVSDPNLRRNPENMWLLVLARISLTTNFRNIIESTYEPGTDEWGRPFVRLRLA